MRTKAEILDGMSEIGFFSRCSLDFKFFCERMLGITEFGGIHDFQMEWFNLTKKGNAIMITAPSGFSKTELMGVAYPLWYALMNPGHSILLFSKTVAQAKDNLLQRIKNYIEDNELLKGLVPEGKTATYNVKQAKFTNGTTINNIPYNINAKGYRAHLIILDEIDSYEDLNIYYDIITSRMHPGGKIVGISTPEGPTQLLGDLKNKNPRGYVFKTTVAIVDEKGKPKTEDYEKGFSIWPERFTIDYLMKKKEEMGEQMWEKNFQCNVMTQGEDAIFSVPSFVNSYDRRIRFNRNVERNAQYFVACDFAISKGPRADFDAFVVVEKLNDFITIKHMEIHKGLQRPAKVNRIVELSEIYHSDKMTHVIADESNMGTMVIGDLRARGLTVKAQNFHYAERKKLLLQLANVIESGTLIIPRSPKCDQTIKMTNLLFEQLIGFRRKTTDVGTETIESKSTHDDAAMSLAMAVKEACQMKEISCVGVSCS